MIRQLIGKVRFRAALYTDPPEHPSMKSQMVLQTGTTWRLLPSYPPRVRP